MRAAPPLLLVPGLDGTGASFRPQLARLERRFRPIVLPYPEGRDDAMPALVAHALAALDRAAPDEPAIVLGESMGGAIALELALAHPARVRGLVLLNSFARVTPHLLLLPARLGLRVVPWFVVLRLRSAALRFVVASSVERAARAPFEAAVARVEPLAYRRRLEVLARFDARPRLGEISAPALILASDDDRLLPSLREGRRLARALPRARLEVLEGLGHACLADPRMDLAARLERWLEGRTEQAPG